MEQGLDIARFAAIPDPDLQPEQPHAEGCRAAAADGQCVIGDRDGRGEQHEQRRGKAECYDSQNDKCELVQQQQADQHSQVDHIGEAASPQ